ncbi:hypothetical protein [Streptomyces paromomycinus]|uniref:hypothetical protein n=1 Tax=Streptomyces paromomycinus TaxID=92743 RepID=UPI001FE8604D|nr:hypothetical protein [Streptomyces paromomycinus]
MSAVRTCRSPDESLGETIRSSLYGPAPWWLDRPEKPREVLVAAMVRITRGPVATASG